MAVSSGRPTPILANSVCRNCRSNRTLGNNHPAAQEVKKHRRDLLESWGADDIAGSDAVDMRRTDVTTWVNQRRELAARRHVAVKLDHRDLNDPVGTRRQPSRFHVNSGKPLDRRFGPGTAEPSHWIP